MLWITPLILFGITRGQKTILNNTQYKVAIDYARADYQYFKSLKNISVINSDFSTRNSNSWMVFVAFDYQKNDINFHHEFKQRGFTSAGMLESYELYCKNGLALLFDDADERSERPYRAVIYFDIKKECLGI